MSEVSKLYFSIINRLRLEREISKKAAEKDLWDNNGLSDPSSRNGYKIIETKAINKDGSQIISYRLYKLIDEVEVNMGVDVVITKNTKNVNSGFTKNGR